MQDDAPLLDLDELQDIYALSELRKLLGQVRQHLAGDMATIQAQAAGGTFDACRASTHRLKSMLMFVTGERLRPDFERLEDALQHEPAAVDAALRDLSARLARFDAELAGALATMA